MYEWELCQEIGGSCLSCSLRTCYSSCYSVSLEPLRTSSDGVALSIFVTLAISKENNYYQIIILLFCGFNVVFQTVLFLLDEIGHIYLGYWELFHFLAFPWSIRDGRVAFCHCSALVQTYHSLIVGDLMLCFCFIFMDKPIPTVKLIRTSALCQIGRVLEGCTSSLVHQAWCAHWNHLDVSHLVHLFF